MNIIRKTIAAALPIACMALTPAQPATASDDTCKTTDHTSALADRCEERGWVIERDFAINRYRWVVRNALPDCPTTEDTDCYLELGDPRYGSYAGEGLSEVRYTKWGGYRLVQYVKGEKLS